MAESTTQSTSGSLKRPRALYVKYCVQDTQDAGQSVSVYAEAARLQNDMTGGLCV